MCAPVFIAALFTISQKVEATQVSINRRMEKQNMVYPYNGILFSLQKEENPDACYHMDESWTYYAKWNKPITKEIQLYDSIMQVAWNSQIYRQEVERWLPGAGGGEMRS